MESTCWAEKQSRQRAAYNPFAVDAAIWHNQHRVSHPILDRTLVRPSFWDRRPHLWTCGYRCRASRGLNSGPKSMLEYRCGSSGCTRNNGVFEILCPAAKTRLSFDPSDAGAGVLFPHDDSRCTRAANALASVAAVLHMASIGAWKTGDVRLHSSRT